MSSRYAANTGVDNEIFAIEEELSEGGYIECVKRGLHKNFIYQLAKILKDIICRHVLVFLDRLEVLDIAVMEFSTHIETFCIRGKPGGIINVDLENIMVYKINLAAHLRPTDGAAMEVILRRFINSLGYLASESDEGDNAGEMSPGSSTESYPAFAHIGLRKNPGKNLNQASLIDILIPGAAITASKAFFKAFGSIGFLLSDIMWVPRMLTEAHKGTRKTMCSEHLDQYENGRDDFLARILAGDETCLHHFEPETKRQTMEGHHIKFTKEE
ncbi:hypothetical protein ANN_17595 [Periplaneta americana]|uniref:Uncharacterized protein n=1 Tax=Periplaneta americana TaxID=6978 RepID=A0ABQ8SUK9_PERAM|nr:hypothetical protein ANN_17595 [Periplaneta americana]